MCRSGTCVCAIQTHTHTHLCSLTAQARVLEHHTRACVHAHDMCVLMEKNYEAAPVIVARPLPMPPEPIPVTISPSHPIAVRTRVRLSESRAMQHHPRRQQP